MKKNLLFVVMMLGVSLCCRASEVVSQVFDVNQNRVTVQAESDFELGSVTILYNGQSYGANSWYKNEINCVFTPEVYGKEIEFRIWFRNPIGAVGDVLRLDPSVLVNNVEFSDHSAPYSGLSFFVGVPPKESQWTNFVAGVTVYRGNEIIADIDIKIKIDTVGPPAGGYN